VKNLDLQHRCYTFESSGIIVYDPYRKGKEEPWSAVVEVNPEITDYYRYHFLNEFKISLIKPNWKPHISLFRGVIDYRPKMKKYWKERHGEKIKFVYTHELFWNKEYVWLNTYFPEFFELREKMGLTSTHLHNETWGHLTIGKFRKIGQLPEFVDYTYDLPKGYPPS
jgi:hypothetical protein